MKRIVGSVRKLLLIGLALLVALPIGMNSWMGEVRADSAPTSTKYPITYGTSIEYNSAQIDGDHVVWSERGESSERGQNEDNEYNEIYLYNYETELEKQITTGAWPYHIDIQGNYIVWSDERDDEQTDIYLYDITTEQVTQITDTPELYEASPAIYGEVLVYLEGESGKIFMQNIDSDVSVEIFDGDYPSNPKIYEDNIVWSDRQDIYVFNTLTSIGEGNPEKIVDGSEENQSGIRNEDPDIYENKIVWSAFDFDNGNTATRWNVYMIDLDDSEPVPTRITNTVGEDVDPQISGNYLAWVNEDDQEIRLYDMDSAEVIEVISFGGEYLQSISLYEDHVVWVDGEFGYNSHSDNVYADNVYSNKNIGSLLATVNDISDTDVSKMKDVLMNHELEGTEALYVWDDYLNIDIDIDTVVAAVIEGRPNGGFLTLEAFENAYAEAITARTPVTNVHLSQNATSMLAAIEDSALELDLTAFNNLSSADQDTVVQAMQVHIENGDFNGFANVAAIQAILDAAIEQGNASPGGANGNSLYSYGINSYGQLGAGNTTTQTTPTRNSDLSDLKTVSAGDYHSLALTNTGTVYSWGIGGGLGYESEGSQLTPKMIETFDLNDGEGGVLTGAGLPEVAAISAGGYHSYSDSGYSLILTTEGDVYAFGDNLRGQLGLGDSEDRTVPTKINGLTDVIAVKAGTNYSLVLTSTGDVYSFGNGPNGHLGHGNNLSLQVPTKIAGLPQIKAIDSGYAISILLSEDGEVYTFGINVALQGGAPFGQGEGPFTGNINTPTKLVSFSGEQSPPEVKAIATGSAHSILLTTAGDVFTFGTGATGVLGHGNTVNKFLPTKITSIDGLEIEAIAAGKSTSLLLTSEGKVLSSGSGSNGAQGRVNSEDILVPTEIVGLSNVKAMSAGNSNALLIVEEAPPTDAKKLTAFSFTSPAATGTVDEEAKTVAVTVPYGTDVTQLAATFSTTGVVVYVGEATQTSGDSTNNFTSPVVYRVIAADESYVDYTVTVTAAADQSAKALTSYSFTAPAATGIINEIAKTVAVTVPYGTNVTQLAAIFTTTGVVVYVGEATQTSGDSTNNFTSPIVYRVIAANESYVDYTVAVTVAARVIDEAPTPTPTPTPPVPTKEIIKADVEDSGAAKGGIVSTAEIERTTQADGTKKDVVQFNTDQAKKTVDSIIAAGSKSASIVIPDSKDEVSEVNVTVPRASKQLIADAKIDLGISTDNVKVIIPNDSLQGFEADLFFNFIPIKKDAEKQEVKTRASNEAIVRIVAGDNEVSIVGRPMTIETNMQNRPVTLIMPLNDVNLSQEEMKDLGIYIEHSDGTKELIRGILVPFNESGEMGMQFTVNKFSTFTLVHIEGLAPDEQQHTAYMHGYADSSFKPENGITRAEMAAILSRVVNREVTASDTAYSDVTATHWASAAISKVTTMGLMKGYSDGTFGVEKSISRAEMAVLISHLLIGSAEAGSGFTDIADHWAQAAIVQAQGAGMISGYADGTFKPAKSLTRAETVTIMNKVLGRIPHNGVGQLPWTDVPGTHWALLDIAEASIDHTLAD